jgi:hypothetical protein
MLYLDSGGIGTGLKAFLSFFIKDTHTQQLQIINAIITQLPSAY